MLLTFINSNVVSFQQNQVLFLELVFKKVRTKQTNRRAPLSLQKLLFCRDCLCWLFSDDSEQLRPADADLAVMVDAILDEDDRDDDGYVDYPEYVSSQERDMF